MKFLKHPTVSLLLKFSFAASILIYMVQSGRLDLEVVKQGFSHWKSVIFALVLTMVATLISFKRWHYLLRGQGLEFSFFQVLRYGLIGCFFNTTMPGAVSGDLIKAWYVVSENKPKSKSPVITSILIDRAFGVFGLVTVSGIALAIGWGTVWEIQSLHAILWGVVFLVMGVIGFFSYMMLSVWGPLAKFRNKMDFIGGNKIGRALLKGYDACMSYQRVPHILIKCMVLSICTHLCAITAVISCARSLGEVDINLFKYFLLVPLGLLTTAVPIAPAGLGVGHVAFGSLFNMIGSSHGAEIFTLFVTFQILVNLSGIIFYVRAHKKPEMSEAEALEV